MTGELGADGDGEVDNEDDDEEDDEEDLLPAPIPLKGAKVAPCGELASPEMRVPIRDHDIVSSGFLAYHWLLPETN